MKKQYFAILIFISIIISTFMPVICCAESDNVELSVSVMPRKITDTINDFDLSKLTYAQPVLASNKVAPKMSPKNNGQVKGATDKKEISISKSIKKVFSDLGQKISELFK